MAPQETSISPEALRRFYAEYAEARLALHEANVRIVALEAEVERLRAATPGSWERAGG